MMSTHPCAARGGDSALGVQGVQAGHYKADGHTPIYGMVRGQEDANNNTVVPRPTRRSFVTLPAKTELTGCFSRRVGRAGTVSLRRFNSSAGIERRDE